MAISSGPDRSGQSSVALLASGPQPLDVHAALRRLGVHESEGEWVVARPDDVAAALAHPGLTVIPNGAGAQNRPAAALQARMARFSDGRDHAARRRLVERLLPAATALPDAARRHTLRHVRQRHGVIDVMPVARVVPAAVLATVLGVAAQDVDRTAALVGALCDALAPCLDPDRLRPDGDAAARELESSLARLWPAPEEVTAVISLLFQARDATAALIGNAVLARGDSAERRVEHALRTDAPVQCTRRTALDDVRLADRVIPRGAGVLVVLAAAEQGPASPPATFGTGPHACPGSAHATALAVGVVGALIQEGWRPLPGQPARFEPRPNLRMPASVLVQRA